MIYVLQSPNELFISWLFYNSPLAYVITPSVLAFIIEGLFSPVLFLFSQVYLVKFRYLFYFLPYLLCLSSIFCNPLLCSIKRSGQNSFIKLNFFQLMFPEYASTKLGFYCFVLFLVITGYLHFSTKKTLVEVICYEHHLKELHSAWCIKKSSSSAYDVVILYCVYFAIPSLIHKEDIHFLRVIWLSQHFFRICPISFSIEWTALCIFSSYSHYFKLRQEWTFFIQRIMRFEKKVRFWFIAI